MAKEFILVPKLQYEKLMNKVDVMTSDPSTQKVSENTSTGQISNDKTCTDASSQIGSGLFVKQTSDGEIPGILDQPPRKKRRKRKNINWIEF